MRSAPRAPDARGAGRTPPGRDRGPDAARLRGAIAADEFLTWFQPVVELRTGRVRGFEALVRWHRPDGDVAGPDRFLGAVESAGLEDALVRRVLTDALRVAAAAGGDATSPPRWVAVNVSAGELSRPGMVARVMAAVAAAGVPPECLVLEISAADRIEERPGALSRLHDLRAAGVRVAVDDVGARYSSLAGIAEVPATDLKLDRGVVARLPGESRAWEVARATLAVAGDLGLGVVAQGVQRLDQHSVLRELGYRDGQGNLLCPPLPPSAVPHYLAVQDGTAARAAWTASPDRAWFPGRGALPRLDDPAPHLFAVHDDGTVLGTQAAEFLDPAPAEGAALVIASPGASRAIESAVAARTEGFAALRDAGRVVHLDAETTVSRITVDGRPDATRFRAEVGAVVAGLERRHGPVRVVSGMGALLAGAGRTAAALALEGLWEDLGARMSFAVLCVAPQSLAAAPGDPLHQMCARHRAAVPA